MSFKGDYVGYVIPARYVENAAEFRRVRALSHRLPLGTKGLPRGFLAREVNESVTCISTRERLRHRRDSSPPTSP